MKRKNAPKGETRKEKKKEKRAQITWTRPDKNREKKKQSIQTKGVVARKAKIRSETITLVVHFTKKYGTKRMGPRRKMKSAAADELNLRFQNPGKGHQLSRKKKPRCRRL